MELLKLTFINERTWCYSCTSSLCLSGHSMVSSHNFQPSFLFGISVMTYLVLFCVYWHSATHVVRPPAPGAVTPLSRHMWSFSDTRPQFGRFVRLVITAMCGLEHTRRCPVSVTLNGPSMDRGTRVLMTSPDLQQAFCG